MPEAAINHLLDSHESRLQTIEEVARGLEAQAATAAAGLQAVTTQMGIYNTNICEKIDDIKATVVERVSELDTKVAGIVKRNTRGADSWRQFWQRIAVYVITSGIGVAVALITHDFIHTGH